MLAQKSTIIYAPLRIHYGCQIRADTHSSIEASRLEPSLRRYYRYVQCYRWDGRDGMGQVLHEVVVSLLRLAARQCETEANFNLMPRTSRRLLMTGSRARPESLVVLHELIDQVRASDTRLLLLETANLLLVKRFSIVEWISSCQNEACKGLVLI
jgi:hypothetical protein